MVNNMKKENIIFWDAVQIQEMAYLNRITQGEGLLEHMATVYAHLNNIERTVKIKWLLLAKEQGTYTIGQFCEVWK